MSQRRLHRAAPALLEASKAALRMLLDGQESDGNRRTEIVRKLAKAIDDAEEPILDDRIRLSMTHQTYDTLCRVVKDAKATELLKEIKAGAKKTKKRIYVTLATNPMLLRQLRTIMDRAWVKQTRRAFERMVEQIDKEVLNKSPLVRLAETSI